MAGPNLEIFKVMEWMDIAYCELNADDDDDDSLEYTSCFLLVQCITLATLISINKKFSLYSSSQTKMYVDWTVEFLAKGGGST